MLCRFRNLGAREVGGLVYGVAGGGGNRFEHGIYVGSSGLGISSYLCIKGRGIATRRRACSCMMMMMNEGRREGKVKTYRAIG
jgi:hypothetical protein